MIQPAGVESSNLWSRHGSRFDRLVAYQAGYTAKGMKDGI